jgi:hypothetical protein
MNSFQVSRRFSSVIKKAVKAEQTLTGVVDFCQPPIFRGHYGGLDRSGERIDQGGYAGVEQGEVDAVHQAMR